VNTKRFTSRESSFFSHRCSRAPCCVPSAPLGADKHTSTQHRDSRLTMCLSKLDARLWLPADRGRPGAEGGVVGFGRYGDNERTALQSTTCHSVSRTFEWRLVLGLTVYQAEAVMFVPRDGDVRHRLSRGSPSCWPARNLPHSRRRTHLAVGYDVRGVLS